MSNYRVMTPYVLQDTIVSMQVFKRSMFHLLLIMGNLLLTCLILTLTRNFIEFDFPMFEEIVLVSILAALITLGFTLYLKKVGLFRESISLLCYVNLIALMLSILVLPYSLINVDRSRSFYVLSWVDQGGVSIKNDQTVVKVESTEAADTTGVELRLKEQQQRGLIQETNGKYKVTNMGELTLEIANLLSRIFNLKNWEANKK